MDVLFTKSFFAQRLLSWGLYDTQKSAKADKDKAVFFCYNHKGYTIPQKY